jgi:hypothetical protein
MAAASTLAVILANAGIHLALSTVPPTPLVIPAQAGIQAVYHYYEQSDKTKDHKHHEHTI